MIFTPGRKSISYCIRIILGCIIVWWSLYRLPEDQRVWAMISVIVVSDPDFGILKSTTTARVVNTVTGCLSGLLLLYLMTPSFWSIMIAISVAVVISTSFKNYPASWKLAPVTVVIVMLPSVIEKPGSSISMLIAINRTWEIIYGCFVAFILGYILSKVKWLQPRLPEISG